MEINDGSEKITSPYALIHNNNYGGYIGKYICNTGIVSIDFNTYPNGNYTLLRCVYNGRLYRRNIKGPKYTKIGLARAAGKFIKELTKK